VICFFGLDLYKDLCIYDYSLDKGRAFDCCFGPPQNFGVAAPCVNDVFNIKFPVSVNRARCTYQAQWIMFRANVVYGSAPVFIAILLSADLLSFHFVGKNREGTTLECEKQNRVYKMRLSVYPVHCSYWIPTMIIRIVFHDLHRLFINVVWRID